MFFFSFEKKVMYYGHFLENDGIMSRKLVLELLIGDFGGSIILIIFPAIPK